MHKLDPRSNGSKHDFHIGSGLKFYSVPINLLAVLIFPPQS